MECGQINTTQEGNPLLWLHLLLCCRMHEGGEWGKRQEGWGVKLGSGKSSDWMEFKSVKRLPNLNGKPKTPWYTAVNLEFKYHLFVCSITWMKPATSIANHTFFSLSMSFQGCQPRLHEKRALKLLKKNLNWLKGYIWNYRNVRS